MWKKSFLFLSFLVFFNINLVRANLKDTWEKQDQFSRSENCSWENAQFSYDSDTRYCVDYSDGRVFRVCNKSSCINRNGRHIYIWRMNGFLNRAENVGVGYGQRQLHQYSIEGNKLINYYCRTSTRDSTKCYGEISREINGTLR